MTLPPPNYTQIPNIIFDKYMAELSFSEFKVFMVLARKTIGWHKQKDQISLNQFIRYAGISKRCVLDALQSLEEKKLITKEKRVLENGSQATSIYGINIDFSEGGGSVAEYTRGSVPNAPGVVREMHQGGSAANAPTKERPYTKEKVNSSSYDRKNADRSTTEIRFSKENKKFENITPEDKQRWEEAYQGVNVDQELLRMEEWLLSNPAKSNKRQWRKFITNWLLKAADRQTQRDAYQGATQESKEQQWARTNAQSFYQWKEQNPQALRHCYIKNGYLINRENQRECRVNLKPDAFVNLVCEIAGVKVKS